MGTRGPRAREGVYSSSSFPNGDTPVRATNDVTAYSRDQVNCRAHKHHSAIGHLDPLPQTHTITRCAQARYLAPGCSFSLSCGAAASRVNSYVAVRIPFGDLVARVTESLTKEFTALRALELLPACRVFSLFSQGFALLNRLPERASQIRRYRDNFRPTRRRAFLPLRFRREWRQKVNRNQPLPCWSRVLVEWPIGNGEDHDCTAACCGSSGRIYDAQRRS